MLEILVNNLTDLRLWLIVLAAVSNIVRNWLIVILSGGVLELF
jgi:hypothetical protein